MKVIQYGMVKRDSTRANLGCPRELKIYAGKLRYGVRASDIERNAINPLIGRRPDLILRKKKKQVPPGVGVNRSESFILIDVQNQQLNSSIG